MELPNWLSKIIAFLMGCAAIFFAFQPMLNPAYSLSKFEKNIVSYIGNMGLMIVWLLAAVGAFWAIYLMIKEERKEKRKQLERDQL